MTTGVVENCAFGNADMSDEKHHLHIVLGGELKSLEGAPHFRDPSTVEFIGAFRDYDEAFRAWKSKALATVDNAHARYFIIDADKLLDPTME
jgi:myo-inositol-1(or 4)-monophosphatase